MRDRPPGRIAAIRCAGDAHLPGLRDPGAYQGLGAGLDIDLLGAAPALLLDRFLKFEAEAGRTPIIRLQHVEADTGEILRIDREGILVMCSWPAVHIEDRSDRIAPG